MALGSRAGVAQTGLGAGWGGGGAGFRVRGQGGGKDLGLGLSHRNVRKTWKPQSLIMDSLGEPAHQSTFSAGPEPWAHPGPGRCGGSPAACSVLLPTLQCPRPCPGTGRSMCSGSQEWAVRSLSPSPHVYTMGMLAGSK